MANNLVTGGAGFIGSHVPHAASFGPAKVGETRHNYLDATKAKNELGWSPTLSLEEGFEKTVTYLKESEQVA